MRNKKRRYSAFDIVATAFLVVLGALLILGVWRKNSQIEPSELLVATHTRLSLYAEEEMRKFLSLYMLPPFNELRGGRYAILEIQKRHGVLMQMIFGRYTNLVSYQFVRHYHQQSRGIGMASGLTNGVPIIQFFMPALMDEYARRKAREGLSEEGLRLSSLIGFMHELDHLAFGYILSESGILPSHEEMLTIEKLAWAQTCEHVLAPLIEKHDKRIGENERLCFENWVRSGRNAESELWKKAIQDMYTY